jgi:hypothetical protein
LPSLEASELVILGPRFPLGEDSQEDQEGQEGRMPEHGFDLPTVRRDAEHRDAINVAAKHERNDRPFLTFLIFL